MRTKVFWTDMPGTDAALVDLLTAPEPGVRCLARALASSWPDTLSEWVNAELARGTNKIDLLHCLATLQAQIYGSLIGQLLRPGGYEDATRLYVELVAKGIPSSAEKARKFAEKLK